LPELPEVQTVVNDLNKKIKGKTILDLFYCDAPKIIKGAVLADFRKRIKNRKIERIERRAKNILFFLDKNEILAVHMKMTGHLIIVKSLKLKVKSGKWVGENLPTELKDPKNQFIRLVFNISGGLIMAFSDLRKFGEFKLVKMDYLTQIESKLGPEPLDHKFSLNAFENILAISKGKIKTILMDQSKISGIGNIYADEILFDAGIRPDRMANKISKKEREKIFNSIRDILKKAIKNRGTSDSDYRDTDGKSGNNQNHLFVYRRTGEKCRKCGTEIKRIVIAQRGTHFCPKCQR